jgi:hypothetical protein
VNTVRQLSVFISNEAGRITTVTGALGSAGISIRGFCVSDTADYGICRLIVDDPDAAARVLRDAGFTVRETPVICVDLPDHPGGLAGVLAAVSDAGVNIEYLYSLIGTYIVLSVKDLERAAVLLADGPVRLVSHEEIAAS